ncbi:phosphatidylserine decarboxylase [Gordonia desulfuricans]|uniref:Phosphatidylserine decarboxylase proenzyme n=1 Tax=Gordonia desulfuricans TaxID=89051 RepID=A0A7K3LV12_9ACTN|nr:MULTISPECIES: phosphatidylserine decarboxylase [Gordonia]EMP11098.1 phosphatidylserine decarboxylase [Gordonia sp. NB41Y]NDK92130.1 phosphatidylserine decarboxylase [Gordonia desulfuricans]WLP92349.1 phosphatidylserine decarboxylase [Gordonia sp. NB41Y]
MARRPRPDAPDGLSPAHLVELVRETVPPVHPAGLPFVAAASAVAVAGRRHRWISVPAALTAGACAAFFRHPDRVPPTETDAVVAAADGQVCLVDEAVPPAESGLGPDPRPRVSVFLSLFDVHVQRVPVAGTVTSVTHTPGRFVSADLPDASDVNERTTMTIRPDHGGEDIAVVQIAGLLARRIVCNPVVGDHLTLGETYGLIRFGSRVDVYLPPGTTQQVRIGQRTVGAETLLASLEPQG